MVFHWSLSDSKFSQISRALLSILTDLKNSVICMVSIFSLISNSSSLFSRSIWRPFQAIPHNWHYCHLRVPHFFSLFFNTLTMFKYLSVFASFYFTFCAQPEQQNPLDYKLFSFLVTKCWVWSSVQDQVIRLDCKIPDNLMRLILLDGFLFVQIPLDSMVKF